MRVIHREFQVAKFNELSADMQEDVLEKNQNINVEGFDWWGPEYDYFKNETAKEAGISVDDITFQGFWSQGDGAAFKGVCTNFEKFLNYAQCPEQHIGILRNYRNEGYINHMYADYIGFRDNQHSDIEFFYEDDCELPDNQAAIDWLYSVWDQTCEKLAKALYESLENEYEYLTSEEAIRETLIANEYEFDTETGEIYSGD